jgi:hypothetical protein
MDRDAAKTLRGLQEAARFVETYQFDLSDEYLRLIEVVEALPGNQTGADKSGRWLGSRAYARSLIQAGKTSSPGR